jgi:hypothetical protein
VSALAVPHEIQWVTGQPLWTSFSSTPDRMRRPALLRFASDSFMDDLAKLLEAPSPDLTGYVAQKRSYRPRPIGRSEPWEPTLERLKLYQSIHGDFYLVAAALVCRIPGLPDHAVNTTAKEQVAFVLRRVEEGQELAWIADGEGHKWRELPTQSVETLATGEDLLPMFPVNFTSGDLKRRLLVGLVPTSSGETFKASGKLSPLVGAGGPADPRPPELKSRVIRPLQNLFPPAGAQPPSDTEALIPSRFILLDLADFLRTHVRPVFDKLVTPTSGGLTAAQTALYGLLTERRADSSHTWRNALVTAWNDRDKILGEAAGTSATNVNLKQTNLSAAELEPAVTGALPQLSASTPPTAEGVSAADVEAPKLQLGTVVYRIRCVYRRPECGALCPDLLSEPTEDFQIAGFFDSDAPARPIRIMMPLDTKPQSLRKFNRNVGFLLSDELRKQMARVVDVQKLVKDKAVEDPDEGLNIGVICSFSLPIITIVALMLLMIMVSLLNIIFWWMPFFRICFPAPKVLAPK